MARASLAVDRLGFDFLVESDHKTEKLVFTASLLGFHNG